VESQAIGDPGKTPVSRPVALGALEPQRAVSIGGDHRRTAGAVRLRAFGVLDQLKDGKSVVHR
jgi:hypothetical protein